MKEYSLKCKLMGCDFELLLVHNNKETADGLLQSGVEEITRIEKLLSEFITTSMTSIINKNAAAENVVVDPECFGLIVRSQHISKLTKGCFDITVSPLKQIYSFKKEVFKMPEEEVIKATLSKVGYSKMNISDAGRTLSFGTEGMRISFAAIGKGYAADKVKQLWLKKGVASGYINASGDLTAFGFKPDGKPWKIGIANPDDKQKTLFFIPINEASVATSGDYEQFFVHNNTRYSHTINPFTGYPLKGIKSVSVFSPSAELSDALATAVYVMGKEEGIRFINDLPATHCIIIDDKNKITFSKNLSYEKSN